MTKRDTLFAAEDVELLSHAVSIHPNLEFACFVGKMAQKHLAFPITSHDEMHALFSIKGVPKKIEDRKIGKVQLRKFLPKEFFPIEDVEDLVGKVLAALACGDVIHYHERFLRNPMQFAPVPYRKAE